MRAVLVACVAVATVTAAVGQTTRPAETAAPLQFVQVIADGDDGVQINDHVGAVAARGEFVYAGIVYRGSLKYFRRDAATGRLTYAGELAFEDKVLSIGNLLWAGGRLYFNAGIGHWSNDSQSRGLWWLNVDARTGKPTIGGSIPTPISSRLFAGPDGKGLYLFLRDKRTLVRYALAADGKPTPAQEVVLKEAGGKIVDVQMAPDGRGVWVMSGGRDYRLNGVEIKADGTLGETRGPWPLAELTAGVEWPEGKWGYGWGCGFQLSPDGRHLYAHHYNYGAKVCRMALYVRDSQTGRIAFKQRIEDRTGLEMVRIQGMAWADGGRIGHYVSGGESPGNVVGWCTRDVQTGVLTFGGTVRQTKGAGPHTICYDPAHNALYAGGWNRHCLYVLKTAPATSGKR